MTTILGWWQTELTVAQIGTTYSNGGLERNVRPVRVLPRAVLLTGTALAVSANVSDLLARTAVDEAVRTTETAVRGYLDPLVSVDGFSTRTGDKSSAIDPGLSRLVAAGRILRIMIWAPDGTVLFTDIAALRSHQFVVGVAGDESSERDVIESGAG